MVGRRLGVRVCALAVVFLWKRKREGERASVPAV